MPSAIRTKRPEKKSKEPHPAWRGIGCVLLLVLTLGSYFLAGLIINVANTQNAKSKFLPFPIPNPVYKLGEYRFPKPVREWPIPGWGPFKSDKPINSIPFFEIYPIWAVFAVFVTIILFSIFTMAWGIMNPIKLGPTDAPPVERKIDKSKVR